MSSPVFLSCPRCGQMDSARKVSSIVQEGTSTGSYQGMVPVQLQGKTIYVPTQLGTTSASLLAQKLTPPEQPPEPKKEDYPIAGAVALVILSLILLYARVLIVEAILGLGG